MNNLDAIMADLLELEPELKNKEPQVRAIVSAMLKARPDTQFDQAFADKLKAQLLATANTQEPATKRAWHFSVPAWSLASVSAAALILAAASHLDLKPTAPASTPLATTPSTTVLGREAFGRFNFAQGATTGGERGGGGELETSSLGGDWVPTIYEYVLPEDWAANLNLPSEAPVFTVARGRPINGDLGQLLGLGALSDLDLSLYSLSAENTAKNVSVSYDTVNNALLMYFNNATPGFTGSDLANAPLLSQDELFTKARAYAEEYGFSLENTAEPVIADQAYALFARSTPAERLALSTNFGPPGVVTITFRQLLNGLPVKWSGETTFSLNPYTGELLSIVAPLSWRTDSESTYSLLTDPTQIETFFKWGGTVDPATFEWDQAPVKKSVTLGQPQLIYNYQTVCSGANDYSNCGTYLLPSLIAEIVGEESSFLSEIIIPLSTGR